MSLRAAINAKCKDCIYDPVAAGTWRAQVAACTCKTCPLWPHRPMPIKGGSTAQDSPDLAQSQEADAA